MQPCTYMYTSTHSDLRTLSTRLSVPDQQSRHQLHVSFTPLTSFSTWRDIAIYSQDFWLRRRAARESASSSPHRATLSPVQRGHHQLLKYQTRLKVSIAGCSTIGLPAFPSLIFLTASSRKTPAKTFGCQPPGSNSDDIAVITPHSAVATSPLSRIGFNSLRVHGATWIQAHSLNLSAQLFLSSTIHLHLIKNVCLLWRSLSPLT
ncbi:hypothetical protein BDV97DRAFT_183606 [Delphinella strobiligena]|nr:hypothetical protein BDV97DRAFT_183606 [Delphinella strobiligena]